MNILNQLVVSHLMVNLTKNINTVQENMDQNNSEYGHFLRGENEANFKH